MENSAKTLYPIKFISFLMEAISWARDNVVSEEYRSDVTENKNTAINNFLSSCGSIYDELEESLNTASRKEVGRLARGGTINKVNVFIDKSMARTILFALTEYSHYLNYKLRLFDLYNDEDCESDEYLWVSEDIGYCNGCIESLEKIAEYVD